MRLVLKVFSLPVILVLSLMVAVLTFLAACVTSVLKFLAVPAAMLGLAVAIFTAPMAGILIIAGAFLISPYGLPLLANWLLDWMAELNFTLRNFITS